MIEIPREQFKAWCTRKLKERERALAVENVREDWWTERGWDEFERVLRNRSGRRRSRISRGFDGTNVGRLDIPIDRTKQARQPDAKRDEHGHCDQEPDRDAAGTCSMPEPVELAAVPRSRAASASATSRAAP